MTPYEHMVPNELQVVAKAYALCLCAHLSNTCIDVAAARWSAEAVAQHGNVQFLQCRCRSDHASKCQRLHLH